MGHLEFDTAVRVYKADPGPANLKTLLLYAVTLERETPWRNMRAKGALTHSLHPDTRPVRPGAQ